MDTIRPDIEEQEEAGILLEWADEAKRLGVWANADTPADAQRAVSMGAEGIGLCRTEHMFLGPERVPIVQEMLFSAQDMDPSNEEDEASARFRPVPGRLEEVPDRRLCRDPGSYGREARDNPVAGRSAP